MIWQWQGVQAQIAWHIPILDHVNFFAFVSTFFCPSRVYLDLIRRVSRHSAVDILMGMAGKPRVRVRR